MKKQSKIKRNHSDETNNQTFPDLTSRRGSLPVDYNRPNLPKLPKPPLTAPLPEEADYGDILDELLIKGNTSSNQLSNKLLEQKEREIERLEAEKALWLKKEQELEKSQSKVKQLEKTILQQNKKLEEKKTELEQTGNDFYQLAEEKDELNNILAEERLNSRKLEKRLEQQINENDWLRSSFQQTKNELLEKTNELVNLKKIEREEKEEWRKIFIAQEEKYETEKKEREKVFNKQITNLRTFQLTADISPVLGRGRGLHKKSHSYSLPSSRSASPRGSTYENKDPLLFELERANRFNPLTSSPLRNNDNDPMEETNTDFNFNQFDDLLNEVNDFANENTQQEQNNSALLEENQRLKENQIELERNYKTLADEKVEQERLLKNFNEKELIWEKEKQEYEKLLFNYTQKEQDLTNENQNLKETLNEKDYQLAETKSKKNQQLKLKEQEIQALKSQIENDDLEWNEIFAEINQEADKIGENLLCKIEIKPK